MRVRITFLTAIFRTPMSESGEAGFALASLDISTGELLAATVGSSDLAGELARLGPREVLIGDDQAGDPSLRAVIDEDLAPRSRRSLARISTLPAASAR